MNARQRRRDRRAVLRFRAGMPFKRPASGWEARHVARFREEAREDHEFGRLVGGERVR